MNNQAQIEAVRNGVLGVEWILSREENWAQGHKYDVHDVLNFKGTTCVITRENAECACLIGAIEAATADQPEWVRFAVETVFLKAAKRITNGEASTVIYFNDWFCRTYAEVVRIFPVAREIAGIGRRDFPVVSTGSGWSL